VEANNDIFQD